MRIGEVDNHTNMSDEKKLPTFKLTERKDESTHSAKPVADANLEVVKTPLTLRKEEASAPTEGTPAAKIKITDILEDAYAPDHLRLKQAKRLRRMTSTGMIVGLFLLSAVLTYSYAHLLKQWPTLEPMKWYLPFICSVALSVAALVKSYQFLIKRHSLSLMLTGLCIAGALATWNMCILRVASQTGADAAGRGVWEPKDMTEALIAYELNACRGVSPSSFTTVSLSRYQSMFKKMPNDQWRPYFRLYLSPSEYKELNSINLHDNMQIVAARMQAQHREQWVEFEALYESPSFIFMLKQAALAPYTTVLKLI